MSFRNKIVVLAIIQLLFSREALSQKEAAKWGLSYGVVLNFLTSPTSTLASTAIIPYGASICDASGNLLFSVANIGGIIYNQLGLPMANGPLMGSNGLAFSPPLSLIAKQPGNTNIYYVFICNAGNSLRTNNYSIVDMSLAAGMGSVTVKDVFMDTTVAPRMAGTKHCNGNDVWIVTHMGGNSLFKAHLLTSTGISPPVLSNVGSTLSINNLGNMKISPNGRKLCNVGFSSGQVELFDFDNSTGIVSNGFVLVQFSSGAPAISCEFSADGTKLYVGRPTLDINQWDLCAGSNTAIAASQYVIASINSEDMQLGIDRKIYVGSTGPNLLGAVNNPNVAGSGCNYTNIAYYNSVTGLPGFLSSYFVQKPAQPLFTYTASTVQSCRTVSFTSPATQTSIGCAASGFTLLGTQWVFGDPASGSANTSSLTNPTHLYSSAGTFTPKLIFYYTCGGGTDTISQTIAITSPTLTINTTSITCGSLGSGTVNAGGGIGPYSYTWNPVFQTGAIAAGLIPGIYTISVKDLGMNCVESYTTNFLPLIPLTGTLSAINGLVCNGVNNASATINNLAGGSGTQNYLWTNGTSTSSVPSPSNLSAGNWSVTVTDALTACQVYSVFTITQPPALTLNVASSSPTACAGSNITFSASNFGGTPAYTYTWVGAGSSSTRTVTQALAGNYVYTVNSRDANLCLSAKTIAVSFVPNPTLSVGNVSICPLETGTLVAGGASTYTWNGSFIGNIFTSSPVGNQQYAVAGTALGCTAATTASIIVKAIPSPTISNNSPICNGQNLLLNSSGGVSYLWGGPNSYTSTIQNPTINPASPIHGGVYNLTVTAANSCTAPATTTVVVNPTPTISLTGGPVCLNSNLVLVASSFTGSIYLWAGPNSFTSSLQNPIISSVTFSAAGIYSLLVTSVNSCSNTATLSIIVNSLPTISIVPSSTVICFGKSTNLIATGGSTYYWNISSSATTVVVSPTVNATYTLTGYSASGCTNTAIQSISVNALPTLSVLLSPSVYCTGGGSTLTGLGANTYTWSNNSNSTSISVSPVFTSFYNVKGTAAITGCSNTAFATVSVNPLPLITAGATQSIICAGISATLIAGGGNTYTWMPVNLNTTTIFPAPLGTTIYTVTGTNTLTGCQNSAIKTISVNITPTLNLVSNTPSLCAGRSAVITPSGALTYTLNPGNLTGTNFTVTTASTTQYSLSGTNSVNCVNLQPSNLSIIVYSLTPITGVVTSTTGLNNGNVVLYKYKPTLGRWDSLATSLIITSNYYFPSVVTGTYVVKAFPFPTDIIETYGLSSSSWQGATIINHDCINPSTQNIDLITIDNTIKSKASLSGKISQGAGYSVPGTPGAPIPNIIVKAGVHSGTTIVQRTRTNAQGNYTLTNLMPNAPGKDYYILADIPGLDTNTTYHRIIITGFENFTNLDFVVDSQRITPTHLTVGIKELNTSHANIKIFPNPASDKISIEFELDQPAMLSIELSDLSGRKVKDILSESKQSAGALTVLASVSDLKEGMYLLQIRIGSEEKVMKVVVER